MHTVETIMPHHSQLRSPTLQEKGKNGHFRVYYEHMQKKKIVLLYFDEGGHKSLAEATQEAVKQYDGDTCEIIPFAPKLPTFMFEPYRFFASDFQEGWGIMYKATDRTQLAKLSARLFQTLTRSEIRTMVRQIRPDAIGTNASLLTSVALSIASRSHIPSFLMVADPFTLHRTWLMSKNFNQYIAPTREVMQQLAAFGIDTQKITTVRWPIRSQFLAKPQEKPILRSRFGLNPDLFTIFVGGSVNGGVHVIDFIHSLEQTILDPIQLIIVTGRNQSLYHQLTMTKFQSHIHSHIFEYIDSIADLISCSDIVVGKAGPNSLFESITLHVPFIVPDTLPGQEDGNSDFIRKNQLGYVCSSVQESVTHIKTLIHNPAIYTQLVDATYRVAPTIAFQAERLSHTLHTLVEKK